jgi:hypothetical protein
MGYWRFIKLTEDGEYIPYAVGTVCRHTGYEYAPKDGYPYCTDAEIPDALKRLNKPRQPYPWERRA